MAEPQYKSPILSHEEFELAVQTRALAKLARLKAASPPPLDGNAGRARIELLNADNARMRAQHEQQTEQRHKSEVDRMVNEILKSRSQQQAHAPAQGNLRAGIGNNFPFEGNASRYYGTRK